MKYIISGTDRPNSRSLQVAKILEKIYKNQGDQVEVIDLKQVPLNILDGSQYAEPPSELETYLKKVNSSSGLIIVCPEYNGSYPGALKYFIDHWQFPKSFEYRPVAFVGLGGRFGGLRPVEHLQGVFGYRNSFIFPERVFLTNIFQTLKEGSLVDPIALQLLEQQSKGFIQFVRALDSVGLSANKREIEKQK